MILIVSNSADFHTDAIINKINELYGDVFFRLNTEFFHRDYEVEVYPNERLFKITNIINNKVISSENLRSIWWRRPEKLKPTEQEISSMLKGFLSDEFSLLLRNIIHLSFYNGAKIITYPPKLNRAKDKVLQQIWAKEVGFSLPDQLITSSNNAFKNYFEGVEKYNF